jgi:large subunit ribosomal protein L1
MPSVPKKRAAVATLVDPLRKYSVEEACALLKKAKYAKFDETVDLAVRLGVNPKHADQMVRGAIVLPHGTGRSVNARPATRARISREATISLPKFRKDSWTSTESSRRRT